VNAVFQGLAGLLVVNRRRGTDNCGLGERHCSFEAAADILDSVCFGEFHRFVTFRAENSYQLNPFLRE
jgi:hypothetical protein